MVVRWNHRKDKYIAVSDFHLMVGMTAVFVEYEHLHVVIDGLTRRVLVNENLA